MGGCMASPANQQNPDSASPNSASATARKSNVKLSKRHTPSSNGGTTPSTPADSQPTAAWAKDAANILPACEPLRLLGEGTFGTVVLVRERSTRNLFAVKVMNKSQLVYESQIDNIITERQVLREAGPHPFVVQCHSGFQTPNAVVLVLEYVPGGDMYHLLRKHGCLSEPHARFYLTEIVVALAELHRHDFVFRDLKLENILIDSRGHVRLTDFGLAGRVSEDGAGESAIYDISGTAIYQAPEMIAGKGHGRVVDWWALGVLAYVLLAGRPPFSSESRDELHSKIRSEQLDLDADTRLEHLSATGKAFINRLLDKDPKTRLGSAGADARDVQSDPFFEGVDWDAVSRAEPEPPLKPGLETDEPAANADPTEAKLAVSKLADKVQQNHKPRRTASGRYKHELDTGEYKVVSVAKASASGGRVSIGLDFAGKNEAAASKTWTGSADDFGRLLETET